MVQPGHVQIYSPRPIGPGTALIDERLVPRPARGRRLRVGLLDNNKVHVETIFRRTIEQLGPVVDADVTRRAKANASTPANAELLALLEARCDVVINALGDCGGCTTSSVQDAVELERRGVPTVTFCTTVFEPLARAAARSADMPTLPLVVLNHPIKHLDPSEVEHQVDIAFDRFLDALYSEPSIVAGSSHAPAASVTGSLVEVEDSVESVSELFELWGATDGLPVVPPTVDRVAAMLASCGLTGREQMSPLPPASVPLTTRDVAVNAVMAGCRPEYLPAVVSALRALADNRYNLRGIQATTSAAAPLLIFSGPIVNEIGLNAGAGSLGPGRRANATIGRAVRLALINLGGASPGSIDPSTQGSPGKYTMCIAENEAESPWAPLHVERGFMAGESTVTAVSANGTLSIQESASKATELLDTMGASVRLPGSHDYFFGGYPTFLLCPEHASLLAAAGYSKSDVKKELLSRSEMSLTEFSEHNLHFVTRFRLDETRPGGESVTSVTVAREPDNIMIVVVGGAGTHSTFVTSNGYAVPVTRVVALGD